MSSINENATNNSIFNLVENANSSNDNTPPPPPPEEIESDTDNDTDTDVENNDLNFNDDDDDDDDDGNSDGNDDENSHISVDGQPDNINLSETLNNDYNTDDDDDDDDDDDELNEDYLQKITNNMKTNIINKFHPELNSHNYDEINSYTKILRDKNNNIIDPFHKTIPILTKYERSRILGQRAKQINSGSKAFVEVDKNIHDGYLIASKELNEKKIPFIIRRPLPNGGSEYWKLEDLEIL
jgi:DNA-directed RNA polymerase I, II, and III subunit RPABC2